MAIQSAMRQDPSPYEVVIGDDSDNGRAKEIVQNYEDRVRIQYLNNDPPLGQAENVDRLFKAADGDYLVLLHDDDTLLPGALHALLGSLAERPRVVAAYGKQKVIDSEGQIKKEVTEGINEGYYRTREYQGVQESSLRSAVLQQFPNDGYMVRTDAARRVGYSHPDAGDACDFMFGVELARQTGGAFYYVDEYTSQYRVSEESIARGAGNSDAAYWAMKTVLEDLPEEIREEPDVRQWIRERCPHAIMRAAQHGHTVDGMKWYFGPYHRSRILSLGGIRRLVLLCSSLTS